MSDYFISEDKSLLDFDVIFQFISTSYWAKGIPVSTMEKAIEHSLCLGVYTGNNQQIGFARVITDYATFAYLADVFVVEEHRGKGLSKRLVEAIVNHEHLQGLRRFMLATSDAHGLYAQYGFKAIENPKILMQICDSNIYQG